MSEGKRFNKVFLHIGLGKTGTTAIQHALLREAGRLETDFDIHYPVDFDDSRKFDGNHTLFLRSLFQPRADKKRSSIVAGLGDPEALARSNDQLMGQFQSGFDQSKAHTLLLSAEGVGHFSPESLARLKSWLDELTDCVRVVVCLRHPRHALAGAMQQRIKTGVLLQELEQNPPHYSFERLFTRLEQLFNRADIIAYDYAEARTSPLGITGLFLQKIGVKSGREFDSSTVVNQSVSYEAIMMLDAINRRHPMVVNGKMNPRRRAGDIQAFLKIPGQKFVPGREVYERLEESVAPDLEWLRKQYGLELDAMDAGDEAVYSESRPVFSDESMEFLALKLSNLFNSSDDGGERIQQMEASTSWRITAPLRALGLLRQSFGDKST